MKKPTTLIEILAGLFLGVAFAAVVLGVSAGAINHSPSHQERQTVAQERMAKELSDIKQILGSWEWEEPGHKK